MNYFKQSGNYVYHMLQNSTALPFAHRVFTSDTQEHTDICLTVDWLVFMIETEEMCSL
jgi:hypothetical protein